MEKGNKWHLWFISFSGFFCLQSAESSTPSDGVTGDICSAGHLCSVGSCNETACTEGYFCASTGKRRIF